MRNAGTGQWVDGGVRCMFSMQELLRVRVIWDGVQLAGERCSLQGKGARGSRDKINSKKLTVLNY